MLIKERKINILKTDTTSARLKNELDKGWNSYLKNKKGNTLENIFKSLGYEFK